MLIFVNILAVPFTWVSILHAWVINAAKVECVSKKPEIFVVGPYFPCRIIKYSRSSNQCINVMLPSLHLTSVEGRHILFCNRRSIYRFCYLQNMFNVCVNKLCCSIAEGHTCPVYKHICLCLRVCQTLKVCLSSSSLNEIAAKIFSQRSVSQSHLNGTFLMLICLFCKPICQSCFVLSETSWQVFRHFMFLKLLYNWFLLYFLSSVILFSPSFVFIMLLWWLRKQIKSSIWVILYKSRQSIGRYSSPIQVNAYYLHTFFMFWANSLFQPRQVLFSLSVFHLLFQLFVCQ